MQLCCKDSKPGIGECCCACKYHFPLMSHPWVDDKPISHQVGWICNVFVSGLFDDNSTKQAILSNEHGQCEIFTPKEEN